MVLFVVGSCLFVVGLVFAEKPIVPQPPGPEAPLKVRSVTVVILHNGWGSVCLVEL
jgi:hypothetical protein